MIEIVEPKSSWPQEFIQVATNLRSVVGTHAVRSDHIGSTAVPDLPAKDIIDLQITVADLSDQTILGLLSDGGYRHREGIRHDLLVGLPDHSPELKKAYFRERDGDPEIHLHVREAKRINQEYPLLFRDFLRKNTEVRDAFGQIKRHLAEKFPNDIDAYYDIKDPYMDTIYYAAQLWKKIEKWTPDDANL